MVVDNNLRIAQHRDTLHYARVHRGAYLRKVFKFQEGDSVYVKLHHPTTLEPRTSPYILRVLGVRDSGALELVGRCGTVITRNSSSCAPCHLPNINPTIDPQLARPIANLPCIVCGDPGREHHMVLCDGCNSGWHLEYLRPPLAAVPRGAWFCPACTSSDSALPATPTVLANTTPVTTRPPPHEAVLAQWYGHKVRKSNQGSGRAIFGTARFLGMGRGSRCYAVSYSNGIEARLTLSAMTQLIEGEAAPPVAAIIPARVPSQLPPKWLLDTYEHVRRCLTTLAPGYWTEGHVTSLLMQATMHRDAPASAYMPSNIVECVNALVRAIRLPSIVKSLWAAGSTGLSVALKSRVLRRLHHRCCGTHVPRLLWGLRC